MVKPASNNLITDVPGITVGNATDEKVKSGVTVLRCAQSYNTAVDVRGGAPGVRETDTLAVENLVGHTDAIVLAGGSVFGLAAADGVTNALSRSGVGLRLGTKGPSIPIVPAAVLHDLNNEGDKDWGDNPPYHRLGIHALEAASAKFELGAVGAGHGAMAGAHKGGLGSASADLGDGFIVGALVAANPVGSVYMPDGKTFYAWPWELNDEFGGSIPPTVGDTPDPFPAHSRMGASPNPGANTTIAVVATSADLSRAETKRIAMMAHDGLARAVRPAHTPFDGDIVFAISSGEIDVSNLPNTARMGLVAKIGAASADCLARAIARAVYEASKA